MRMIHKVDPPLEVLLIRMGPLVAESIPAMEVASHKFDHEREHRCGVWVGPFVIIILQVAGPVSCAKWVPFM